MRNPKAGGEDVSPPPLFASVLSLHQTLATLLS